MRVVLEPTICNASLFPLAPNRIARSASRAKTVFPCMERMPVAVLPPRPGATVPNRPTVTAPVTEPLPASVPPELTLTAREPVAEPLLLSAAKMPPLMLTAPAVNVAVLSADDLQHARGGRGGRRAAEEG